MSLGQRADELPVDLRVPLAHGERNGWWSRASALGVRGSEYVHDVVAGVTSARSIAGSSSVGLSRPPVLLFLFLWHVWVQEAKNAGEEEIPRITILVGPL